MHGCRPEIEAVIERVMSELRQGQRVGHGPTPEPKQAIEPPPAPTELSATAATCFPTWTRRSPLRVGRTSSSRTFPSRSASG